jgi:PQQ-dependent dehydrogenase (s-GDH family)
LSSTVRKTRIERYTYNSGTQTLGSPVTVLQDIPGSNDHNSARIAIGPDLKLYYTVGDMGAGQFDNATRTNNAQNTNIYEGKVLRLNTEPDGLGSWIPADNPFANAVYSFGHRNAQGLVWGKVNGVDILYNSEHGPWSDDEVNVIERGRNYGWPRVAGYCDGNYNGKTIGGFAVVNEQANCVALNAKEPMRSIFPSENPPTSGDFMTWPTMAICGADFYGSNAIPGWQNSLLIATLKSGKILRYQLSNDGLSILSDTINYFKGMGRYRDVVVSSDGLKIYVACDSSGNTSGPTGSVLTTPPNPGSILEFTYQGPGSTINRLLTQSRVQEEKNDRTVDVYPNPANNYLIVYNYKTEKRRILLYDMSGKAVRNVQANELATRLNTQDLKTGLYILSVKGPDGKNIRTEKIVIVR